MSAKTFWVSIALIILQLFMPAVLSGKDEYEFSRDIRKEARRRGFKDQIYKKLPNGLRGQILTAQQAAGDLRRFLAIVDDLGVKFVRKSGLKNVMIIKDLTRYGKRLAGHASNDSIYLKYGFNRRTVYHELFHVFDNESDDKEWQRFNHKKFRYRGVSHPERPQSKSVRKKLEKHYRKVKMNFDADFASSYAQTNEREDRAETFAAMLDDGPRFAARAAKNPVLYAKMQYIIKLTTRRSLLSKEFWQQRLYPRSAQKKYSKRDQ